MKKSVIGLGVLGIGVVVLSSTTGPNLNASINSDENNQTSNVLFEEETTTFESSDEGEGSSSTTESMTDSSTTTETTGESSSSSEEISLPADESTIDSEPEVSSEDTSTSTETTETSEIIIDSSLVEEELPEQTTEAIEEDSVEIEEGAVQPGVNLPSISDLLPKITPGTQHLPEDLKTNKIAKDYLSGFELPLLSSYQSTYQGVIVYEAIKNIGIRGEKIDTLTFIDELFEKLVNQKITDLEKQVISNQELLPGDILYVEIEGEYQLLGLYLGDSFYVSIEEEEVVESEDKENKEEEKEVEQNETKDEKEKDKKEIKYFSTVKKIFLQEKEKVQIIRGTQTDLTDYGKEVLADYPASFDFSPNLLTQRFIEKIGEDARKLGLEYDVFASVMIAQAILESGGGTSTLSSAPYNNLFGIKGGYEGNSVTFSTNEDVGNGQLFEIKSAFRAYPDTGSSLSDYVHLIRGGISGKSNFYEEAWRSNAQNYLRATHSLTGKYATDTYYHKKLNSIIAAYHLTAYDQPKISEAGVFIQDIGSVPEEYRQLMAYPIYDGKDYNASGSYPAGQCTWYAFNRVSQLGLRVDEFMGNGGEWGITGRRLGYNVSSTPQAGTLISFTPGTAGSSPRYGHVAFVEAVGVNGILISEGNVYGEKAVSYRVISNELAHSNLVSYITPKS